MRNLISRFTVALIDHLKTRPVGAPGLQPMPIPAAPCRPRALTRRTVGVFGQALLALAVTLAGVVFASAQTPVITAQPQSRTNVLGYPAAFSVSANNPPFGYQWRKESVPIPGATNSTLTLASVKYSEAGSYSVLVSNLNGVVASSNATLTVTPPTAGELDFTFNPGTGADSSVYPLAVQPDGKVLIGGYFTTVNGTARTNIARLNSDGSLDTTFQSGMIGANDFVRAVAMQADGKVLIGGQFTSVNGTARTNIARLNADGSLDTTFQSGMIGANYSVWAVAVQADGKVLIGGQFTSVNGTPRNRIARLNPDGSLDTGFLNLLSGANDGLISVAVQPDGKVLIGGYFTSVNGTARNRIARLNADGSLDTGFLNGLSGADCNGCSPKYVYSVVVQPDGKVLISGDFTTVNGTNRNRIARLNPDGNLDTSFQDGMAGANDTVYPVALQPDGRVLIGGNFTTVNGTNRNRITRLNTDGSLDTSFQNGMAGANIWVYSVAVQPDGKVLLGGDFTTVNGTTRIRIARLYGAAGIYDVTDADGDGLPNSWERQNGLDPEVPNRQMGTGRDGALSVGIGDTYTDDVWARVLGTNAAGSATLNVSTTNRFASNDLVLIITMQDTNLNLTQNTAGTYEFGRIAALNRTASLTNLVLTAPRSNAFTVTTSEKIQVLKVPEYTGVTAARSALSFNGTDDYVRVPDSPALRLTNRFTLEFWFKPASLAQGSKYLLSRFGSSAQSAVIFGYSSPNQVEFYAFPQPSGDPRPGSAITLPDTGWHHLAYSYDSTTWAGYLDGVQKFSTSRTFSLNPEPADWFIGAANATQGNVAGNFTEVRFWNVGRSAAQITDNMRQVLTGEEPGLVACYHFNEGTGATAYDATPNHFNGGLNNNPVWVPSGSLTCHPWNGTNGGVLAFLARSVTLGSQGLISADGKGYRGGSGVVSFGDFEWGISGERTTGFTTNRATDSLERAQGGGGAGKGADGSGGGGSYASKGANGEKYAPASDFGRGAQSFGTNTLSRLYFGGGGGGSGSHSSGADGVAGGAGGGIVFLAAGSIQGNGAISSCGAAGSNGVNRSAFNNAGSGGGGGAGGSIWLAGSATDSVTLRAAGGPGGIHHFGSLFSKDGGAGGAGRIRLDVPASATAPTNVVPIAGYRTQISASNIVAGLTNLWGGYLDSDNDGLDDWQELVRGTNPNNADTDGDGMSDGWEVAYGLNPINAADAALDSDGDGVANVIEFQRGTDPNERDTDHDGLSDYQELFVYHTDPRTSNSVPSATGHRYYYDALDRLVGVDYTNGLSLLYAYDGNDNLVRQAYLAGDANTNGVPDAWEQLHGLTNGLFADTDGDGAADGQEWWAGTNPGNPNSVPLDPLGPAGSNLATITNSFIPANCVVGVGQLDGLGAEEIVIGADGNPGTTNFLVILSQTASNWTNERVDVGTNGVTSIAVGQPANCERPAIYVGLRQAGGHGSVAQIYKSGTNWVLNTIATSTNDAAFVLGVRPGRDVLASFAQTNAPAGTPYYLAFAANAWTLTRAATNTSQRGLGAVTLSGLHGQASRGVRLLDAGGLQVLGDEGLLPTNNLTWNPDASRWFFLTPSSSTWDASQQYARGLGANLATVNDEPLNIWLKDQFWTAPGVSGGYWIGLSRQICCLPNETCGWQWASGAPFTYYAWLPGEPSCSGNNEFVVHVINSSGQWNDLPRSQVRFGVVEREGLNGPSVSTNEPPVFIRLPWRGHSLCAGDLRLLTNALSIFYATVADTNRNNVLDAGDEFMLTEYLFDGNKVFTNNIQRIPLATNTVLAPSYGLACVNVLYGNQQVLFTAEPDGRVFSWSATNGTTALQRQLFSAHDQGKAWHALAGVKTLDPAQSLLGLRVDPAVPQQCDVVLWPPLSELSAPPDYPQTAPIAQILPEPNVGTNLAPVNVWLWDAAANPAKLTLQYQRPYETTWRPATLTNLPGYLTTYPTGTTYQVSWDAAFDLRDLRPGFTNTVQLRARAQDFSLIGNWSAAVAYQVRTFTSNNPQAHNDSTSTPMNQPVDIDVLANDTAGTNPTNKLIYSVTQPANGTTVINANATIRYTPHPGFIGNDSFEYWLTDGAFAYSNATVTVTVTAGAPVMVLLQSPSLNVTNWLFSMLITGPAGAYRVQASPNLTSWSNVMTVTNVGAEVLFTHQAPTNARTRFYRAVLLP